METAAYHQQNKKLSTLLVLISLINGSLMVTNVSSDNTDVNSCISGLDCKSEDQLLRELSGSHLRLSASHVSITVYCNRNKYIYFFLFYEKVLR